MKKTDTDYISGEGIATEGVDGDLHYISRTHRLPTIDHYLDVSRGNIPGATLYSAYGERTTVGAETNWVIWPNGAFTIPPATGLEMSVVSTSANDAIGGTGLRSIRVIYLDTSLNEQYVDVELNGLTPVVITGIMIRFIQCTHVLTAGSGAKAAGIITIYNGVTTYSQINAGEVRCSSSARMVPAGKRLFIASAVYGAISGTSAARVQIRLVANEISGMQFTDPFILIPHASSGSQDTSATMLFNLPYPFSEGTVVAMTGTTDKAATISGTYFYWLENI